MSIYTRISSDIYFLNDKNIVSSFEQEALNLLNPIPSKDLLISVYNDLSGKNNNICSYISSLDLNNKIPSGGYILDALSQEDGKISYTTRKLMSSDVSNFSEYISNIISSLSTNEYANLSGIIDRISETNGIISISFKNILSDYIVGLPEYVKSKIDEIDQSIISSDNKLIFGIDQTDGKISAYYRNITSSDFGSNKISTSQVDTLETQLNNISSNFVKKAGDDIDHLSVKNELTAKSFSIYQENELPNHFTDVKINEKGIYVNLSGDNSRIINLSLENSTKDVLINGTSLCSHIYDEIKTSSDSLIDYVKNSISALDVTDTKIDHQFVTEVSETDGLIQVKRSVITSSDIPLLPETLIQNLTNDLNTLSTDWLKKSDFDKTLSGSFKKNQLDPKDNSFRYDMNDHAIYLDVKGNTLSIDTTDFIKNRSITHVKVVDGSIMYIWFTLTDEEGNSWATWNWNPDVSGCPAKEGVDYVKINVKDLSQVYIFQNGISADKNLNVGIDRNKVPFFDDLNYTNKISSGKIITALSEISGVISYDVKDLSTTDVNGLDSFVSDKINLSVANITSNIDIPYGKISNIKQENGKIEILTAWMTSSDFKSVNPGPEFVPVFQQIYIENLTSDLSYLRNKQNTISVHLDTVSSDLNPIKTYVNELSVKEYGQGIIYTLSTDISSIQTDALRELKFDGTLKINKSDFEAGKRALSTLIINNTLAPENYIKNGSIFKVLFDMVPTSAMYETEENLHLGHGDYVIIEEFAGNPPPYKINVEKLIVDGDLRNVWTIKAGVSKYEFDRISSDQSEVKSNVKRIITSCYSFISSYGYDMKQKESISCIVQIRNMLSDLTSIL